MTFKSLVVGVSVAASCISATVIFSPEAEAAAIQSGSTLNINSVGILGGGVKRTGNTLDFFSSTNPFNGSTSGQFTSVAGSTGTFFNSNLASLYPPLPRIKDLALVATANPNIFSISGPIAEFLTGIDLADGFPPSSVRFDLTSFLWNRTTGDASLTGFFVSGADSTAAQGLFTSQLNFTTPSSSSYSLSIMAVPEAIPTPALLPGLIGMGIAALRRKQDDEVAEENV